MNTLGVETSGRAGSIALVVDGEVYATAELCAAGRRHARTLVPEVQALLRRAKLAPGEIGVVAVSIGPGSFTGLRVGTVFAKTYAYAARCALVGVDTFLAVAAASPVEITHLWVIDDALREDVYAGEYARENNDWRTIRQPRLMSLDEWKILVDVTPVSGPGVKKLSAQLKGVRCVPETDCTPRAEQIALLGERMALAKQLADPWTLAPHYIRRSAAEEKADAGHLTR